MARLSLAVMNTCVAASSACFSDPKHRGTLVPPRSVLSWACDILRLSLTHSLCLSPDVGVIFFLSHAQPLRLNQPNESV